jgi:hypothetical protein
LSASAGHGDLRGFYNPRWSLPVSAIADDPGTIRALVRREYTFGSDWIKTSNTGGYFSPGDDPARVTWFDDEKSSAVFAAIHTIGSLQMRSESWPRRSSSFRNCESTICRFTTRMTTRIRLIRSSA